MLKHKEYCIVKIIANLQHLQFINRKSTNFNDAKKPKIDLIPQYKSITEKE